MNLVKYSVKPVFPKFDELVELCTSIVEIQSKNKQYANQIMLQTNAEYNDWFYGVGTIENYADLLPTRTFNKIQPALAGSIVEEYFNWLEIPVFRSRLMMMDPKSTYSIHSDHEFRFHLPLISNKNCYMIFPTVGFAAQMYHFAADGATYWANTRQPHTAANFDLVKQRLHLVMCVDKVF